MYCELTFQENDIFVVLLKMFKGMIPFVCNVEKFCKTVAGILRLSSEFFIDYDLIDISIQLHLGEVFL